MIKLNEVKKQIDKNIQIGPLTFTINPGTVTALIGNNGAGKSTLIRMITGMVYTDSGNISRFNNSYDGETWKEFIGYVPQTIIGYERFSLKQVSELHAISFKSWDKNTFSRLVEKFDIPITKRFDALSVGMQKKALFILALSHHSKLLIMDEPLSGVDIEGQEQMRQEWITYLEEDPNRSILFATHVPDEVKEFADYIVCMKDGTISNSYEKDDLLQKFRKYWVNTKNDKIRNFPGVIHVVCNGTNYEVFSDNIEKTEESFKNENIEVISEQNVHFSDTLRLLLKMKGEFK
ncbi:ABC transporter ATP-binding protein [Evansella cellulosilytica]|uniref:ABC transporter related protein n=1 Tax=Evansella cellulosilytica (strain ATCC 21833 / DSM 2522 / FERM P-1141 / JCM 9156 / N-4) TaxID=649639 RepID=E6TQK6_EVAC2|nr:ABC transporter ATP-binding protein [Evansella cellulosilytica]ADU30517.1 ABC transporter related protein [Evansella cellulosilytica DSM 2522]